MCLRHPNIHLRNSVQLENCLQPRQVQLWADRTAFIFLHSFLRGMVKSKRRHSSLSDISMPAYGNIDAVFVLYKFSVITPLFLIGVCNLCLACIHASFTPFVGEHAYLSHQTKNPSL